MPTATVIPDAPVPTSRTMRRRPSSSRPRRSRARRSVFAASLVLIGAALAVTAWHGLTGPTTRTITTIRPTQQVDRIEVDIEAGAIEVVAGDEVVVDVASRSGRGAGASVTNSGLNNGVLTVSVSCSRLALLRSCDTPVSLVVPPGTPLIAAIEAGSITASDLTAGADLRAAAGSIDVHDLAGTIRLRSDAGSISGSVLRGTVDASASSGSVIITVIEDLTSMSATTKAGTVALVVPAATYRVDSSTPLGRTDIDLTTSADASRVIEARSEVGNVAIRTGIHSSAED